MPLQRYTYRRVEYYVDYRLKQFRTTSMNKMIQFIDFGDELGDRILTKMIRDGQADLAKLGF